MLTFIATARFSCTSAHTSCYATARFSCTSTHTSCYARTNEERQSATKDCHSCGTRSIAPNIRTIHRNSTWLRKKSNYDVQKKHTTLFLFPTNLKFKNHAILSVGSREKNMFAKHEPGSNKHPWSCKHLANANVKPMKNTENTMKFPPTKRLRMDIHDLNICYPSANSFRLTANPPGKPNMLQERPLRWTANPKIGFG